MKNNLTKRILRFCLIPILAAGVFLCSPAARATPLGLTLFDTPDIFAGFIEVTYDAGDDLFVASGFAESFDPGTGQVPIVDPVWAFFPGTFEIDADITDTGALGSDGGTLSITGQVVGTFAGPTLLTGTLIGFGFQDGGGDIFEFLFDVTGGDMEALFESGIGVRLDANFPEGSFDGTFDADFSNLASSGHGVSNTGTPVPEPATLTLMLLGGAGLYAARKRTRTKNS